MTAIVVVSMAQVSVGPLDATRLTMSVPVVVTSFTGRELHGFPTRLDWSPDGRQLHLRVVQRDRWANEKEWHYLASLSDGTLRPVDWGTRVVRAVPGAEVGPRLPRGADVQD